jgi:hypothetical protein
LSDDSDAAKIGKGTNSKLREEDLFEMVDILEIAV